MIEVLELKKSDFIKRKYKHGKLDFYGIVEIEGGMGTVRFDTIDCGQLLVGKGTSVRTGKWMNALTQIYAEDGNLTAGWSIRSYLVQANNIKAADDLRGGSILAKETVTAGLTIRGTRVQAGKEITAEFIKVDSIGIEDGEVKVTGKIETKHINNKHWWEQGKDEENS